MSTGFALRAPWYVRERGSFDLRDPQALRPALQMYGDAGFVDTILADPRVSLRFGPDDFWSYPVPTDPTTATGRQRFASHQLARTEVRKLYQPNHDRFYALVVEVFCDQPGLPRAGSHSDIEVGFVMRRQQTTVAGTKQQVRRLARSLVLDLAKTQTGSSPTTTSADSLDVLFADLAWRRRFAEDHAEQLSGMGATTQIQSWMVNSTGGVWASPTAPVPEGEEARHEEELSMWRLPPGVDDCEAARTRSLWFGVVPTFSGEHWLDAPDPDPTHAPTARSKPKLDDHAIYQLCCFVRQRPEPGREHCPPRVWWGAASEPFRLADPMDPDGTKNHTTSITAPDLRRLAARAGQPQGPGGTRITTPPDSALGPVPFGDIPGGSSSPGGGGSICTFAFELFFIIAFFLFLLFLPIVIFIFQLWWMLLLRFCIPPSLSFDLVAKFFADGHLISQLDDIDPVTLLPEFAAEKKALEDILQLPGGPDLLMASPAFTTDPTMAAELVAAMNPMTNTVLTPEPPLESKPDDPLCSTRP